MTRATTQFAFKYSSECRDKTVQFLRLSAANSGVNRSGPPEAAESCSSRDVQSELEHAGRAGEVCARGFRGVQKLGGRRFACLRTLGNELRHSGRRGGEGMGRAGRDARGDCQYVDMPSTTCAYCLRLTHMTRAWVGYATSINEGVVQGAATCDNCGRVSIGFRGLLSSESATGLDGKFDRSEDLSWFPRVGVAPAFPDVPAHIARAAREAHEAHSISALMAAILMARTVVEATAKEKGITSGMLVAKIDQMQEADLIRRSTAEAAHEIRHFGNDMAHGDLDDVPNAEDAAEILALMDEILNEVFQGPARTQRIRDKRMVVSAAEGVDDSVGYAPGGR